MGNKLSRMWAGKDLTTVSKPLTEPPRTNDILGQLPPELRSMIYGYLLAADKAISIQHGSSHIVLREKSCSCCSGNFLNRNQTIAILYTCRLYRTEGLPVLMAGNDFIYEIPERGFNQRDGRTQLKLDHEYLRYIKRLSIVHMTFDDTRTGFVEGHLNTLLFMNALRRSGARLNRLLICADTPRRGSEPSVYNLEGTEVYVPTAYHMFTHGQIRQLVLGSYARRVSMTADDDPKWRERAESERLGFEDIRTWFNEELETAWEWDMGDRFLLFDAYKDDDLDVKNFDFRFDLGRNPFNLHRYQWMLRAFCNLKYHKWYGQALHISEAVEDQDAAIDDVDEDESHYDGSDIWSDDYGLGTKKKLVLDEESWPKRDGSKILCHVQLLKPRHQKSKVGGKKKCQFICMDVQEDEQKWLEEDDLNDLRLVQNWWDLYLASLVPSQRHITNYFPKIPKHVWRSTLRDVRCKHCGKFT